MSSYVAKREKLDRLLRKQLKRSGEAEQHHEQLRQHFQEVGPVVMVNELKLTVKGRRIQLSDDQIKFLNDLWTRRVRFAILVAGRGAGKTLCLAILGLWFIVCHDEFDISSMGGSMAQSEKIQGYISEWERKNKFIRKSIMKNVLGSGGRHAHVTTTSYSQMLFMSCSVTSVMGPHTQILFIDEVCVPPETELLSQNTFQQISDCKSVLTHEGNNKNVQKLFQRYYDGDLVFIQPYYNNIGIKVTPNHPILAIRRGEKYEWGGRFFPEPLYRVLKREPKWVKAESLQKNDILVFPIPTRRISDMKISDGRLRLVGYWISEGSTGDHQIYFSNKNKTFIQDLIDDIKKEFKVTPSITKLKDGVKNIYFTNHKFRRWLLKECGHRAENKRIPERFMHLPKRKLMVLLNAILRGDGHVTSEKASLHVASKKLVQQFWYLNACYRTFSTIRKLMDGSFEWCLWKGKESRSFGHITRNKMYVPIRKISRVSYSGKVCNLVVEDDNSYTVPYISLHNCAGEEKGNIKAIKGSFGEVSTSSDITVVLTSTAHYLFGFFKEVLDHPEEHGFTVYCWSIAKHESGIEDPYQIYRFKTGWKPNVPWVTQRGIDFLRKNLTDDEWLVDALGGVGIGTGSVVHPEDLDVAICSKCEVCEPYKFPKCTLVTEEQFKQITERRLGIDYGDVAPNAFVVVGRNKEDVYVLYANELTAVRDYEVLDHVDKLVPQWNVEILYPDPENYSMNNMLEDRGHTIHKLYSQHGGQEKLKYVRNVKWHFENQKLHIPKAYDKLINSIQGLTYDEKGNIRKINDHSWDSLMHSLSGYYRDTQKYLLTTQRKFIESLWGDERDTETFSSDTKLPWENKEL